MKKKICLIMCMVLIVTAFASVAFARKEGCSYCGTDMVCYDVSDEYVVRVYTSTCLNYSNRLDTMRVWGTDYFFKCPNRSCGIETFTNTTTRTERICDHPKDSK